jgi:predicted negative regulator of RcsB-dependent stress response
VDEYLSEKEQLEQIRQWWADYGWYLVGGAAIALLGFYALQAWENRQDALAESAATLYRELEGAVEDDDLGEAERVFAVLQAEHAGSPYTDNGALLIARTALVSDTDRAIAALRGVMDDSDDAELAMIARLRLARILGWREQRDAALELLSVDEPGPFAARISEIRGDVLFASGDSDGARAAWTAALILPGADAIDRSFLQIKLNSLMSAQPLSAIEPPAEVDLEAIEAADGGNEP